jgi:hypothetical protein
MTVGYPRTMYRGARAVGGRHPPVLVGVLAGVAAAVFAASRLEVFAHGDLSQFIGAGSAFAEPKRLPAGIHVVSGSGYDGQFYYRLALDPFDLHRSAYGITFDDAYRIQRITYSFLAWMAAGGQQKFVPLSLVLVNVVALAILAGVSAQLSRECKRPEAYGLLIPGYFGFLFTLGRDLTEISEILFVVVGLVLLRRERPIWAAVALTAAVLSRETALVVVGGLAVARILLIARRRGGPGRPDVAWLAPMLVYTCWEFIGWRAYGSIPLRTDSTNNVTIPFVSAAVAIGHYVRLLPSEHALIWWAEFVGLGLIVVTAGTVLRRSRARSHEKWAWALATLLCVCLSRVLWLSHADFRGFEDLYVMSVVLLLDTDKDLRWLAVVMGALWVVTFVHRTIAF